MNSDSLEFLRWLIDRSDRMRSAYGNRAYNVLTANAAMFAAVVFLTKEALLVQGSWIKLPVIALLVVSAVLAFLSLVCAIFASAGPFSPATQFNYDGAPARTFLNYRITIAAITDYAQGFEVFQNTTDSDRGAAAFHELLVGYRVQEYRYRYLRLSGKLLLGAAVAITLTVVGMASTDFFSQIRPENRSTTSSAESRLSTSPTSPAQLPSGTHPAASAESEKTSRTPRNVQ